MSGSDVAIDYGWRLKGKPVQVLHDRSWRLPDRRDALAAPIAQFGLDSDGLQACLQCGVCTTNCGLADDDSTFPRKQIALIQLGRTQNLLSDPDIWRCYNCSECSSNCSSNAKPGQIMAALRQMAIEHYAVPSAFARAMTSPRKLPLVYLASAFLVLCAVALGGSFHPQTNQVLFSSMLPHLTLNIFFTFFTAISALCVAIAVHRAWRAYSGYSLWQADIPALLRSGWRAVVEGASHRNFRKCRQFPLASLAHAAVMAGFSTLLLVAGYVALGALLRAPYPLSMGHPLKLVGNIAAFSMIAGLAYFALMRWLNRNTDKSATFDWLLLANLLAVAATGMMLESFRYANLAMLAYPVYFIHLVFAFVLLVGLPYTKLVHIVYRVVALTAHNYNALTEDCIREIQRKAA